MRARVGLRGKGEVDSALASDNALEVEPGDPCPLSEGPSVWCGRAREAPLTFNDVRQRGPEISARERSKRPEGIRADCREGGRGPGRGVGLSVGRPDLRARFARIPVWSLALLGRQPVVYALLEAEGRSCAFISDKCV